MVKAAWNIFGKSYEYRQKYNEYKRARMEAEKAAAEMPKELDGQINWFEELEAI